MVEKTRRNFYLALAFMAVLIALGTAGYMILERWSFLESLYMTIISITTTGFAEVRPLSQVGRIFTIVIIVVGVVTIAYIGGRGAQLIIESQLFRLRRMSKKLAKMHDHYIVCGFGRMGRFICEELRHAGVPFVVVETDPAKLEVLADQDFLFVPGDATLDDTLQKAGVERARGLVAVLPSDAENVFTTLSAKGLNPRLFVVSRAVEEQTESKLLKAGADRVVKPYELGGTRMAQLLLRPAVVDFIDIVARGKSVDLNLEEIRISPQSGLVGQTLAESPLRSQLNIMVVAIFRQDGQFIYNPRSSTKLQAGDKLIVIGEAANLARLTELC
ncbi:MAG: potassium channel protein [Calditrichaeota bacterium]|nr:MAG: potassium channel protein [Calditrichota bacterium]